MKYHLIRPNRASLILGLAALFIVPIAQPPAPASADAEPQNINYMQIYSAGGIYTRAKITITPPSQAATHSCGGTFGAQPGNASNELTIKLYKSRPKKIRCDAVGGGTVYSLRFLKGKKSASSASDYKNLPNDAGNLFGSLDIDNNNVKPYKSCMTIHPATGASASIPGSCSASADTIPQDNRPLSCQLRSTTGVSPSSGPGGRVELHDTGPWDGTQYVSRPFCTGSVTIRYQRVDVAGPLSGPYNKKLRFKSGHCEAKLLKDRFKLARKATYNITASFSGNNYFNAPSDITTSFTTR